MILARDDMHHCNWKKAVYIRLIRVIRVPFVLNHNGSATQGRHSCIMEMHL